MKRPWQFIVELRHKKRLRLYNQILSDQPITSYRPSLPRLRGWTWIVTWLGLSTIVFIASLWIGGSTRRTTSNLTQIQTTPTVVTSGAIQSPTVVGGTVTPAPVQPSTVVGGTESATSAQSPTNILQALGASLVLGTLITSMFVVGRIYNQRPRHIFYQFEYQWLPTDTRSASSDPVFNEEARDLRSIALTLSHLFTRNVQRAGHLLTRRHIEDVRLQSDTPLALIVRSGHEDTILRQLEQFGEIQIANITFPFGRFLAILFANRADTRVQGSIHRNRDGELEVWMSVYIRKRGQSVGLGRYVIQQRTDNEVVTQQELANCVRAYTAKLAIALEGGDDFEEGWPAFAAYIDGLEASATQNWWHAVIRQRDAVSLARSYPSLLGRSYYQIGAGLLLQGEPRLAYEQLLLAEQQGDAPPELYYLLGLTSFALHFDRLGDVKGDEIRNTMSYLHQAMKLRSQFPQALHLLGAIAYNRGRMLERRAADHAQKEERISSQLHKISFLPRSQDAYKDAEQYLARAYGLYDRDIRHALTASSQSHNTTIKQLVRAHLTVAHHWADALRSLGAGGPKDRRKANLQKASLLYTEAQIAYPGKSRNLIDQLLTHTLSGDWKEGIRLFDQEVQTRGGGLEVADIHFYVGWMKIQRELQNPDLWDGTSPHDAFPHLNLALLLRPQFMFPREQTAWTTDWQTVIGKRYFLNKQIEELTDSDLHMLELFFKSPVTNGVEEDRSNRQENYHVNDIDFWFFKISLSSQNIDDLARKSNKHILLSGYLKLMKSYILYRNNSLKILLEGDASGNLFLKPKTVDLPEEYAEHLEIVGYINHLMRMKYSSNRTNHAHSETHNINNVYSKILKTDKDISDYIRIIEKNGIIFYERCYIDLFMRYSMLRCHNLALASEYSLLREESTTSLELLKSWIDAWGKINGPERSYSPDVFRYYIVTFEAWNALTYIYEPAITKKPPPSRERKLQKLYELIETVGQYSFSHHPLYLYVCSEYYRQCNMLSESLFTMVQLTHVNAIFENQRFSSFNFSVKLSRGEPVTPNTNSTDSFDVQKLEDSKRSQMFERMLGQRQFEYFTNTARTYTRMADVASRIGNRKDAVDYLLHALTWSPYTDLDLQNTLKLIEILISMDAFHEALSALIFGRSRLGSLVIHSEQHDVLVTLDVYECILHTRLGEPEKALTKALHIARHQFAGVPLEKPKSYSKMSAAQNLPSPLLWDHVVKDFTNMLYNINKLSRYIYDTKYYINSEYMNAKYQEHRNQFIYMIQACELYNNIAYNLIKIEAHLEIAVWYSAVALRIMTSIYEDLVKSQGNNANRYREQISIRIAQYYDTLGWILYRRGSTIHGSVVSQSELLSSLGALRNTDGNAKPFMNVSSYGTDIEWAIFFIEQRSLLFSKTLAVPHYHLSRCYIALAEQGLLRKAGASTESLTAAQIQHYIHNATQHWKLAHDLNTSGRLTEQLNRQRPRIDALRQKIPYAIKQTQLYDTSS